MHLDLKHTGIVQFSLQNIQAVMDPQQMRAGQGIHLFFGHHCYNAL